MPNVSEKDILRRLEMLARVKPDADSTERALGKVREQLLSGALRQPPASPRIIQLWQRQWVKTAVAAVIAMVIAVGGMRWLQSAPSGGDLVATTGGNPSVAKTPVMPLDEKRLAALLADERVAIDRLYETGDRRGLAARLVSLQPTNQAQAARYLAEIGGAEDIPQLQMASNRWTGAPADNHFQEAIAAIQTRVTGVTDTSPAAMTVSATVPVIDAAGFQPQGVLSGVVQDMAGAPIEGLTLEIAMPGGDIYPTQTDAKGAYSFDMVADKGTYLLRTLSTAYLPPAADEELSVVLGPESHAIKHLRLQRGCQVEVEVVNQEGQPVRDVRLIASWMGSGQANDVGQAVFTDKDGHAKVGAFAPVEIAYQLTAMHPEYALQGVTVKCVDRDVTVPVRMELQRGRNVPGTAVYANGTPAREVQIVAQPNWWNNSTSLLGVPVDRDGAFVLSGIAPGYYSILAFVGDQRGGYSRQVTQVKLPLAGDDVFELVVPGEPPQRQAAIRGRLTFQGDARPETVYVLASPRQVGLSLASRQPLNMQTETFALEGLLPGDYTLVFDGPQIREKVVSVSAPSADVEVALEVVPNPVLKGAVLAAATGMAVDDFRVGVMKIRNLPGLLITSEENWHRFSNSGGRFELPASEGPGRYQLRVVADGYVVAQLDAVDSDDPRPAVFDLSVGGRIEGQVITANRQPVAQARIALVDTDPLLAGKEVVTDAQGRFVFEHVEEGPNHTLKITHDRYSTTWVPDVTVWDSYTTGPLEVAVQAGARLEGYVFNVEGEPEANVALLIQDGTTMGASENLNHLAKVVTNESGYYQVDGLPANICFVQRRDWDRVQGVVTQAVVPVAGETVQMDLGGKRFVRGTLVLDGRPVTNHRLLIADAVNPRSQTFRCFGQTDNQGQFALSGIPAGQFGIYIQDLEQWNHWLKLSDFRMVSEDLDLGTLPGPLATVQVTLTSDDPRAAEDWRLYLVGGDPTWGDAVGLDFPVTRRATQQVIDRVPPGRYTLVARNLDGVRALYQSLEVATDSGLIETTLTVPTGVATLSGAFLESMDLSPVLFSYDHSLCVTLKPRDAFYFVPALPAGRYFIGNPYLRDKAPLVSFTIEAGEHKVVDINPRDWSSPGQGLLAVLVTDSQNMPLPAANAWLEGPAGRIDPVVRTDREQIFVAPVGSYQLQASYDGFPARHMEVSIEANDMMALYPERPLVQVRLETP